MNREEAIKIFQLMKKILSIPNSDAARTIEAIDMAIEALSADAVEVKAEQLPPKVPTEWINDGMVLVPQHDWIEMQKKLEGYVSANAVQGEWGHMMIDGNKLMLALSEWWYSSFGLEETEESKAIHKVMDEVERYVDHEKSADYWIPCSERLPSEDGCYLVSTTGTNNDIIDIAYYTEEIWHKASRIKAWMPLPKPYREESEVEE